VVTRLPRRAFGTYCADKSRLFRKDFDKDSIGEGCAAEQLNGAVAGEPTEHLIERFLLIDGFCRGGLGLVSGALALRSAVHGLVCELVSRLVFVAQGMGYFEPFKLCDAAACLLPQRAQIRRIDFVLTLDLFDHELGVRDDAEASMAVIERPLEAAEQAGILGVVVGADAEKLGQLRQDQSGLILQKCAVAGGSGIAAGSAVAMGDDPASLGAGDRIVGKKVSGGTRHRDKFTSSRETFAREVLTFARGYTSIEV
jgi:hypothetical protein